MDIQYFIPVNSNSNFSPNWKSNKKIVHFLSMEPISLLYSKLYSYKMLLKGHAIAQCALTLEQVHGHGVIISFHQKLNIRQYNCSDVFDFEEMPGFEP
jgi:hypothetical protein